MRIKAIFAIHNGTIAITFGSVMKFKCMQIPMTQLYNIIEQFIYGVLVVLLLFSIIIVFYHYIQPGMLGLYKVFVRNIVSGTVFIVGHEFF